MLGFSLIQWLCGMLLGRLAIQNTINRPIGSGISPLLAPPEVAYQIQDAGIKVIITLSELASA
ncbi:MAG: hypothetical protein ACJASL_002770 [Paraglaciecola sp.]|jgi:hypothetical protein